MHKSLLNKATTEEEEREIFFYYYYFIFERAPAYTPTCPRTLGNGREGEIGPFCTTLFHVNSKHKHLSWKREKEFGSFSHAKNQPIDKHPSWKKRDRSVPSQANNKHPGRKHTDIYIYIYIHTNIYIERECTYDEGHGPQATLWRRRLWACFPLIQRNLHILLRWANRRHPCVSVLFLNSSKKWKKRARQERSYLFYLYLYVHKDGKGCMWWRFWWWTISIKSPSFFRNHQWMDSLAYWPVILTFSCQSVTINWVLVSIQRPMYFLIT